MRNERGLTLVELLAVLALISIVTILLGTIFIDGLRASDRGATNQKLQQEANYIVETIRNEYLKKENDTIKFEIITENDSQILEMDGNIISQGYTYCYRVQRDDECVDNGNFEIDKGTSKDFFMELKKGDSRSYKIETTFSKLR